MCSFQLFARRKPNCNQDWQRKLPDFVKRLEEALYRAARSKVRSCPPSPSSALCAGLGLRPCCSGAVGARVLRRDPACAPYWIVLLLTVLHGPVATLVALIGSPVALRRVPAGRLAVAVLWTGPAAAIASPVETHISHGHVARVARPAGCSGPRGPSVHRPDFRHQLRHQMAACTYSPAWRRHTKNVPFACDGSVHASLKPLHS